MGALSISRYQLEDLWFQHQLVLIGTAFPYGGRFLSVDAVAEARGDLADTLAAWREEAGAQGLDVPAPLAQLAAHYLDGSPAPGSAVATSASAHRARVAVAQWIDHELSEIEEVRPEAMTGPWCRMAYQVLVNAIQDEIMDAHRQGRPVPREIVDLAPAYLGPFGWFEDVVTAWEEATSPPRRVLAQHRPLPITTCRDDVRVPYALPASSVHRWLVDSAAAESTARAAGQRRMLEYQLFCDAVIAATTGRALESSADALCAIYLGEGCGSPLRRAGASPLSAPLSSLLAQGVAALSRLARGSVGDVEV